MSLVAEAVYRAFDAEKLNYELLGAGAGVHMHWHFSLEEPGMCRNPALSGSLEASCTLKNIIPPRKSWRI